MLVLAKFRAKLFNLLLFSVKKIKNYKNKLPLLCFSEFDEKWEISFPLYILFAKVTKVTMKSSRTTINLTNKVYYNQNRLTQ